MRNNTLANIIISGGQTGADRGALEAAFILKEKELIKDYGGYIPRDRKAEDGLIPLKYVGLKETASYSYAPRTELNVKNSDATIIFANTMNKGILSRGSERTKELCFENNKDVTTLAYYTDKATQDCVFKSHVAIVRERFRMFNKINIAGNRESVSPGIQDYVKRVLLEAFNGAE